MPTTKQQRSWAGEAMHSGTKAIQNAALFNTFEQRFRRYQNARDTFASERESGNILLTLLVIIGLIGLSVGSFYVGKNLWGELLVTYGQDGERSYLVAGAVSVAVALTFMLGSIVSHLNQGGYTEAGFTNPINNDSTTTWLVVYIILRLGVGVAAWWFLQVSLSAISPNFSLTYNELSYVFADLLLIVGEWILSRWMGRHGIINLQYALAGLRMRWAERGLNRSAERVYENYFRQQRHIVLYNDAGYQPPIETQGSAYVQRAINYHMGTNPANEAEQQPIVDEAQPIPAQNPNQAETVTPQAETNLDADLNDVADGVNNDNEEEPVMTMDDYLNEEAQKRENNLFD